MIILTPGQKGKISDTGCAEIFPVVLNISAQEIEIDTCCFGLDANGQLSDDRYMVFFNQKSCPNGGIRLELENNTATFYIDISKIPNSIQKIVFTISVNNEGNMRQLGNSTLCFGNAVFRFSGKNFNLEKAIIVSEFYKREGQWRFGAVGQGFNGGLPQLLKNFGGAETIIDAQFESNLTSEIKAPSLPSATLDLINRLTELADRIKRQKDHVKTEEAVKTAFILPFIQALGYDIFNPAEVIPEHTADHGVKKGEKVDYAIKLDGKIKILIECKQVNAPLASKYAGQLFRYFSVTEARFGILTDGIRYLFYSDLDAPNRMDEKPFFEFNLMDFNEVKVNELNKFSKLFFNTSYIISTASNVKHLRKLVNETKIEFSNRSEDFILLLANRAAPGVHFTEELKEQYKKLASKALEIFLQDAANLAS